MIAIAIVVIVIGFVISYYVAYPLLLQNNTDVFAPRIFFTTSGDIAVMYYEMPHGGNDSQRDVILTVYDSSGDIIKGPQKIAHLYTSLDAPGIWIPHSKANIIMDKKLNAYIVQVARGHGKWKEVAKLSIINPSGKYIVKNRIIPMDCNNTDVDFDPSRVSLYPVSLIVAGGYLNIFIEYEDDAKYYPIYELHYFKYTLSGNKVGEDILISKSTVYGGHLYSSFVPIKNDVCVIINTTHAMLINTTTSKIMKFVPEFKYLYGYIHIGYNQTHRITYSFLVYKSKYYPISKDASVYSNVEYTFHATIGGCTGGNPKLLMSEYVNWKLKKENKTIFVPERGGDWCYNPDIFGIQSEVDKDGRVYVVWYVNNGCNHFSAYIMALKDTKIIFTPRTLPLA